MVFRLDALMTFLPFGSVQHKGIVIHQMAKLLPAVAASSCWVDLTQSNQERK